MIVKTIYNASQFRDEFIRMGRADQFSYEGLEVLFDYYDDLGESVELDVIGICCEFTEYNNFAEYLADYPDADIDTDWLDSSDKEIILEYVNEKNFALDIPGADGFIVGV